MELVLPVLPPISPAVGATNLAVVKLLQKALVCDKGLRSIDVRSEIIKWKIVSSVVADLC